MKYNQFIMKGYESLHDFYECQAKQGSGNKTKVQCSAENYWKVSVCEEQ